MLLARVLLVLLGFVVFVDAAHAQKTDRGWLGIEVISVTESLVSEHKLPIDFGAFVTEVKPGSPVAAEIKPGDVITSINTKAVRSKEEYETEIAKLKQGEKTQLGRLRVGEVAKKIAVTLAAAPSTPILAIGKDAPLLMLDTGGHTALIKSLTFTPDGNQIVSAGDDKVLRVWDRWTGQTIRTIRGNADVGTEGKIYAMALSPDGKWLAVGGTITLRGEPGIHIRLYDFASGQVKALLKGHRDKVDHLAFSADSKLLISGSHDTTAIIWDVASAKRLHQLMGHTRHVYGVGFTPDGARAVTASFDTTLRLWRVADGGLIAEMKGHKDMVRSLAISPVDGRIASGSADGEIRLWDGTTGQPIVVRAGTMTLANQGRWVAVLRFSPDGTKLLSGTGDAMGSTHDCHVWDVATGQELVTYRHHDGIVIAADISPDGRFAATGGGRKHVIQVWDLKTGDRVKGPNGQELSLAGTGAPGWAAGFSTDGARIAWGSSYRFVSENERGPFEHQLRLPGGGRLFGRPEKLAGGAVRDFIRAQAVHKEWSLTHRPGGDYGDNDAVLDVLKDGRVLTSIERGADDGYSHRSYTFTPDGETIISGGSNGYLIAYDLAGKTLGNFIGHEGEVWAVAPSPDDRLLVSVSADQTIRLWNLKTRELIVTLFNGKDGEWVMWTPQGYYTGSPGADKIVGWQINKGPDHAPDYVGADQLRQHLNRPDIVTRAIVLASAEAAVRDARGTIFKLADLLARPVPRFTIISPLADAVQRGGRTEVKIAIEATPDPVKAIRVQVNGRQVDEQTPDIGSGGFGDGDRVLDVPLANGRNEVRITLTNAIGEKAETLTLMHEGEGALDKRGTLYVLAIGVDKYPGLGNNCGSDGRASCNLTFSAADARALVAAIEKRLAPVHTKLVKHLLVNGAGGNDEPTAANILNAIDMLKEANETDTVLLIVAGHGYNDGPNYRFLPTNAELAGGILRGATVVPWYALQEAVETAKGRRILFIDTCHSGNAYNQQLGNAAYHANIIAYTAARFDQEALEDAKLGHGLFTYAVVEGLEGKGKLGVRGEISTKELADYVIARVEELAKAQKAEQEPQYFKGRDAEDYVLVREGRTAEAPSSSGPPIPVAIPTKKAATKPRLNKQEPWTTEIWKRH